MIAIVVIHMLALGLVVACSFSGATAAGVPVFAWCALFIFGLQWLAFVPAYLRQTERYYDLLGSMTYVCAVLMALFLTGSVDARSLLLALVVSIWALRLGSFLFRRIRQDGHDRRFDKIKPNPVLFFRTWSLQGLWVLVTAGAALAAITSAVDQPLGPMDFFGLALWLTGFCIEVLADAQKRRFRKEHGAGTFISTGLWALSRHPNYFGEILLWVGVAMASYSALQGWQYVALVSPLFVYLLLAHVSGIPLLERAADRRWGNDPAYLAYKNSTPLLVLGLSRQA